MDVSGFSQEAIDTVEQMLYGEMDWPKQFRTGKAPSKENPENYKTGIQHLKGPAQMKIGQGPGDMGKRKVNAHASMIAGTALPKGPGNPQAGSSIDVHGMRMLG